MDDIYISTSVSTHWLPILKDGIYMQNVKHCNQKMTVIILIVTDFNDDCCTL